MERHAAVKGNALSSQGTAEGAGLRRTLLREGSQSEKATLRDYRCMAFRARPRSWRGERPVITGDCGGGRGDSSVMSHLKTPKVVSSRRYS